MGEGVEQRGSGHRYEEVLTLGGIQAVPAEEVGGREDLFLAFSENRRMSKDYERLPESSEALIYAAMSRLMARRLARS